MDSPDELMQKIIQLTAEIETKFPELYIHLGETPFSLRGTKGVTISAEELDQYLETLKSQLKHHLETHDSTVK